MTKLSMKLEMIEKIQIVKYLENILGITLHRS